MTNKQTVQTLLALVTFAFLCGATLVVGIIKVTGPSAATAPVTVEQYEDGSGVLYQGDQEIKTFPEDTFVWNCRTMGNQECGPSRIGSLWNDVEAEGEIQYWGQYDGHDGCEALLGDTTVIRCADGYKTTS